MTCQERLKERYFEHLLKAGDIKERATILRARAVSAYELGQTGFCYFLTKMADDLDAEAAAELEYAELYAEKGIST